MEGIKRAKTAMDCLVRAAAVSIACLMFSSQAAGQQPATPAGSYEVRICKKACTAADDESVLVKGYVVLFEKALAEDVAGRLPSGSFDHLLYKSFNACFALQKVPGRAYKGYAGIQKSGVTFWSAAGEELQLSLMRSPDAGYGVSLRPTAMGLEGEGRSWGAGVAAPQERVPDYVAFSRVGESDVRRCEQMPQQVK
jgi:hypothetical protein